MKVLCAPDSFRESLSAQAVALAMSAGIARADPNIECGLMPLGDGGEGTMDALMSALGGRILPQRVIGPRGEPVDACLGLADGGRLGIVELARASGLTLLRPSERDPTQMTTFGTGQLIVNAIAAGCQTVLVCIGGSATVDGGTGIAQALGARFFDQDGRLIGSPMTGGDLERIGRIEPPQLTSSVRIRVACDVTNPLCGPSGAAAVYGPQKGATPEQVRVLDDGLTHLASIVGGDPNQAGAGAAGGAGFGLAAMCDATLERGIELVLDVVQFERRCAGADLVLTGEGRLDAQSLQGKACIGVSAAAATLGVPTIAIVGSTGPGAEDCVDPQQGRLAGFISLADTFGMQRAMSETAALIEQVACDIVRQRRPQ